MLRWWQVFNPHHPSDSVVLKEILLQPFIDGRSVDPVRPCVTADVDPLWTLGGCWDTHRAHVSSRRLLLGGVDPTAGGS